MHEARASDDVIDECPGNTHGLGIADLVHDALHLGDDDSSVVFCSLGNGKDLTNDAFAFHAEIAQGIRIGGANQAHMDRERLVTEPVFAVDFDPLNQVLHRAGVHFPPAVAGIDEGVQPHLGKNARTPCGNLAQQHA